MSFPRYPAYKDSGVEWLGEVPEHWGAIKARREITFLTSGSRGWAEYYSDEGPIFLRIGNLTRDSIRLNLEDIQRVTPPAGVEGDRTEVNEGDVLFSITAYLGSVAVVPGGLERAYVSQHVCLARLANGNLMPDWLAYSVLSASGKAYLEAESYGGTKVQLALDDVKSFPLSLPPIKEQRSLITFLDHETAKIDTLIAEQQRLIELLQEKRQAVICHAVTKGLNPDAPMKDSGVEWLGEVPEHWEVMPLKRIVEMQSGNSITAETIESAGAYPVYGGNGLRGYTSSFTHSGEFVLIGRQGALCGNINYATGRFFASEHAVVASARKSVDVTWLGEMMRTMNLNQYSVSAAQPGLSVELIGNVRTIYAPLKEQRRLAGFLSDQSETLAGLSTEAFKAIDLLQERRSALISAAVTGQIDVRGLVPEAVAA
jgi:type I restriction enzyme, S subunit